MKLYTKLQYLQFIQEIFLKFNTIVILKKAVFAHLDATVSFFLTDSAFANPQNPKRSIPMYPP